MSRDRRNDFDVLFFERESALRWHKKWNINIFIKNHFCLRKQCQMSWDFISQQRVACSDIFETFDGGLEMDWVEIDWSFIESSIRITD